MDRDASLLARIYECLTEHAQEKLTDAGNYVRSLFDFDLLIEKKPPKQVKPTRFFAPAELRKNSPERERLISDTQQKASAWLQQSDGSHPLSATAYLTGENSFPAKKMKIEQLAGHFEEQNKELNINKPATRQLMADAATHDVMYALTKNGNAVGWYDDTVDKALNHIAERLDSSITANPENGMMFKIATAITSQGQNVFANFEDGFRAYRYWRMHGVLPTDATGFGGGKTAPPMIGNFRRINEMYAEFGIDGLKKILETRMSMGELRKEYGIKVSGESVHHVMEGSALLGPKIGSFYGNLNKRFDSVTMDLWFSRTMRRMAGDAFAYSEVAFRKQITDLKKQITAGQIKMDAQGTQRITGQIDKLLAVPEGNLTRMKAIRAATDLEKYTTTTYKAFAKKDKETEKSFSNRTAENMLAKNIHLNLHRTKDAPKSATERTHWRDIIARLQKNLKAAGIVMTNADVQAVLWYSEKALYKRAGALNSKGVPADYLDAAHNLIIKSLGESKSEPNDFDHVYGNADLDQAQENHSKLPDAVHKHMIAAFAHKAKLRKHPGRFGEPTAQSKEDFYDDVSDYQDEDYGDASNYDEALVRRIKKVIE